MKFRKGLFFCLFSLIVFKTNSIAQCTGQYMEPGFSFLTSSKGCAPFTVRIATSYLASTPGTIYYVDWGDGTAEETYTQTGPTGVELIHTYPNKPVECGYDLVIDAENSCNPRGSVIPVGTQVVVWANDILSINPGVFRVCQGFATDLQFKDNSNWNCYPRDTRENVEARWIEWIYGTGLASNRISGIGINSMLPGAFPYLDPLPGMNPKYPVFAPGEVSLPITVPATLPGDVGKEFEIILKNWNQCNAYDNNILDGNFFNPVGGDLINGDNSPEITTAKIVVVASPLPNYQTRLGNASGPLRTTFCVGEDIYFEDLTPSIAGSRFKFTWEFYDNEAGTGGAIKTSTAVNPTFSFNSGGGKLIRLTVKDRNAAGNCDAVYENIVFISPTLNAKIGVTDLSGNPASPIFCQNGDSPQNFELRFVDNSEGMPNPKTRWKWEFYDENSNLVRQEPGSGAFSTTALGPFDEIFITPGVYAVKLIIQDEFTSCLSEDEVQVMVYENPKAFFSADNVCEGGNTTFSDGSTLNTISGESIVRWEWDFDYDGVAFTRDPTYDQQTGFERLLGPAGTYNVALRVTTDKNSCTDLFIKEVTVAPLPVASITPDKTEGCSDLNITFTNNGAGNQPTEIVQYIWEVDEGSGFVTDSIQQPSDINFSNEFTRSFKNNNATNKEFSFRLRAVAVNGCETISAPVTITVLPAPESGFISINYSPFNDNCSPVTVDFQVDGKTRSLNPDAYIWQISDAQGLVYEENSGTDPSFSYTFENLTQSVQDYSVILNTTLAGGCSGDSVRTIRINPNPSGDFSQDTLAFDCNLMEMRFEAEQKGLSTYYWEISENGVTTFASDVVGETFDYTFNRGAGNLDVEVKLQTTNFARCKSEISTETFQVPQKATINAGFSVSPKVQTLPNATVAINNTTTTGPWEYLWDFGDGNTSTDPLVSAHTYDLYGTYQITLTVTYGVCVETHTETVIINPIPPIIDFQYDPASGCAPLTVHFENKSKYADPGSYFWEFGNNQGTSKAENPAYTFYEAGTYSVSLSATNITGDTIREIKPLIIEVYDNPVAQFEVKPFVVYIPDNPLYTDNNSLRASDFQWDFGDGTTSTEEEPVHYYKEEGVYDVTLIAFNQYGCSDTTKREGLVQAIAGGRVLVPNAFSPNLSGPIGGEAGPVAGINDIFLPISDGITEFEMLIFNRWGELLFRSTDKNIGWDGYYQGKLSPQDVYVYKLNLTFEDGRKATRMGDINLIR